MLDESSVALHRCGDPRSPDIAPLPAVSDTDRPTPKNQQFTLLNTFRRERVLLDVYLVSGVRLRGRVRSFDQYSMVLDTGQGDAFLYHHAVSSVSPAQGRSHGRRPPPGQASAPQDDDPPMRRPAAPPKPPEVTVVRRVSRKITLPEDPNR
jgi:host factor-I protein